MFAGPLGRSTFTPPSSSFESPLYGLVSLRRSHPRHNVTFSRLYKDDAGEWKSTQSFGRNDLLVLAKVADLVHTRLFELPREEEQETES